MKRRQWFNLHSWAGMQFCLLLAFVLLTGTLATVSRDIDWLCNPAMRAATAVPISQTNWVAMLEQARAYAPGATVLSLSVSQDSWHNAETLALDSNGQRFRLFHDRASGAVTGSGRWYNWQRLFRQLHRHLMLPATLGITLVCLLAVPLLISLASSLYIYRHWYRHFFRWPTLRLPPHRGRRQAPSRQRRQRQLWGELHKFAGLWSLWFIVLIAITGLWYLIERWGLQASYPPEVPASYQAAPTSDINGRQLGSLLRSAGEHYPEMTVSEILLPSSARPWLSLRGQAGALLVRDRANQLTYDVNSGKLLSQRRGTALSLLVRISEAADPLHFGTFGNATTRWLWFFFGAILSALAITGVYLSALRLASNHQPARFWYQGWQQMRFARWPLAALLAISLLLTLLEFMPPAW